MATTAGKRPVSPWPKVVLVLGVMLIIAATTVAAVALWPRESPQPVSSPSPEPTPTTISVTPTVSPATDTDLSATELAERYGTAVWRVETEACGYEGFGTAFAVGSRTLVTNAHVVAADANPTVLSRDGGTAVEVAVTGLDADLDVAVLMTDHDLPGESLTWTDADDLTEGQELVALGYPVPDYSFAVTPATVMSFQTDGSTRQALRLDSLVDKGNSGGPVLTGDGRVAGMVTGLLDGGYQWVAVAYTYDHLAEAIQAIERDRPGHAVTCDDVLPPAEVPDGWEWDDAPGWEAIGPERYGDDPTLDRLYDQCRDGDMAACDDLYWQSPYFSEYESFAASCGETQPEPVWGYCTWYAEDWGLDEAEQADTFGDDPYLDEMWTRCADGDMAACDDLYYEAPIGSDYERFGATCGDTGSGYGLCAWEEDDELDGEGSQSWPEDAMEYGDDPYLDELWDACADADLVACDTLYYDSPIDSEYEQFGAECGGHLADPWAGACSDGYDEE